MKAKGRDTKPHVGIFGRRNVGKSSLINALVGQDIAIVSEIAGTTTDPVKKSIEIHGLGPLILIDTAGIDDSGELGELRIKKTMDALKLIDLAILVLSDNSFDDHEAELTQEFGRLDIPYVIVHNKSDLSPVKDEFREKIRSLTGRKVAAYSALFPDRYNPALLEMIKEAMPPIAMKSHGLIGDLVNPGDIVLLVTPVDIEAPEGRMILPQVQVIRDTLDNDCTAIILKETDIESFLEKTGIRPQLVVTDSQVFGKVNAVIPRDIPLTGFSIVLARQKGDFEEYLRGTPKIGELQDGDRVLLLESCTHNVSCEDIGRVKIPRWLTNFTGKKLDFDVVAGLDTFPRPIEDYALVIQCGGCMVTHRQLVNRLREPKKHNVAITNYGMAIAYLHGIFDRAIEPFTGKRQEAGDL
ncbi:MAG TPA: [FeFe] hydrogenase H-cluster maturation GTPase HydF [Bacteroidales bacterium]|jgi:[FeFe] hydrogenase H-cluster maturation GTPase HydF|nr:[FeFe] hydrogenase H-cluster maturation GTPase HydF [Bacteroidales bacterium]MDI9532302.1 [FeFe] hydrogenase H-cluster maturation GTPase HydF [Bacteroidota bacterium]MBP7035327.1 [FeFe] hydrogenase H-cluster maturation GTPase HydF [Bacteroidales bacterium]MBP8708516.1 [FeFe] hydrogenase H-cluster maturation GTPase HydF [Bacteroidales bacterium]HHV00341.1 [FeFe] hydrogenase H-cluster maturation GTPase HydF [Bacteroidales bacterium]